MVWSQTEGQVVDQLLKSPALIKLGCGIVSLNSCLVTSGADGLRKMGQSVDCCFRIKASMGQIIISTKNVFKGSQGVKNGIFLHLELFFALLSLSNFTLIKSLHLVNEYLVSLQLQMLVLLNGFAHIARELLALARLDLYVLLIYID